MLSTLNLIKKVLNFYNPFPFLMKESTIYYLFAMKTRYLSIAMSCTMLFGALPCLAFDDKDLEDLKETTLVFTRTKSDPELYNIINKQRPVEHGPIPVPHFAIRTPDNKFVMTIGGQINPIIGCDLGNDLYGVEGAGINFVTNQIPVPPIQGHKSDFYLNALNASIDFQVVGLGGTPDQITGYLKIGTDGVSSALKLKRAYITWRGFTAGSKTTVLEDGDACSPPTIDPQGPSGEVGGGAYELSYISPSKNGFRAALGVSMPTFYASSGRYHGEDYQAWEGKDIAGQIVCDPTYYSHNIPDIPMWVEWQHSSMNRIRLSGIIRNFTYRDVLANKRRNSMGWGVMLSGNLNPVEPLIFYLQAIYGKGIGTYIQDIAGMPVSFIPKNDLPGKMSPTPMMGVDFGVTYNFTKKWQANAVISEARVWNAGAYSEAAATQPGDMNNYRFAVYAAGNVFYQISSYFSVGLEYLYGFRRPYGHKGSCDNRIQTQFTFTL